MKNFKDVVEVVKAHKAGIVKGLVIGGVGLGLSLVLGSGSNNEDECVNSYMKELLDNDDEEPIEESVE